ncbi:MAG: hypothetical protein J6K94_02880 [Ruminiclostridium sp.]|nr:hypothetical protein [Ruminiclostridium sp.]
MPEFTPQQVQDLLKSQAALRQALNNPETQKVLRQLQAAAQAAMKGDSSGLSGILQDLSRNPEAAQAIEHLNQQLSK